MKSLSSKLTRTTAPAGLVALLILTALIAAACLSDAPTALGRTYQGPILQCTLGDLVVVPQVVYTEEPDAEGAENDYVILPSSLENELVAIFVRVDNHAATVALLNNDAQPAELRMDSGRYYALNTAEVKEPATGFYSDADKESFIPFIRGAQELPKDFGLDGWIIFDVPKGSRAESFKWEAGGDIIIIDL